MYLIDSSLWIEYFRSKGSLVAKQRVREALYKEEAVCCGVVVVEILRGAKNDRDFDLLSSSLLALPQLPIDEEVIKRAARWGYQLDRKGKNVSTTDLLIASTAFKETVVLHADSDFETIASEVGLKQEKIL